MPCLAVFIISILTELKKKGDSQYIGIDFFYCTYMFAPCYLMQSLIKYLWCLGVVAILV